MTRQLPSDNELFEKVLEIKTNSTRSMIEMMMIIQLEKYNFSYILCEEDVIYVALNDGLDAIEIACLLETKQIEFNFANKFAYVHYTERVEEIVVDNPIRRVSFRGRGRSNLHISTRNNNHNRINHHNRRGQGYNRNRRVQFTRVIRMVVPNNNNGQLRNIRRY